MINLLICVIFGSILDAFMHLLPTIDNWLNPLYQKGGVEVTPKKWGKGLIWYNFYMSM